MPTSLTPASRTIVADTAEHVAEAIRDACAERNAVYPVGGATALALGAAAEMEGLSLALGRLNSLIDYPSGDLTVTVEAGMTIGELARILKAKNQRLPLDIPRADRATVGGAMATNLGGPRRFRFGTLRDYLLGFTAIDGSGSPFSAGGRVVKNAAGYDLGRLMVGSLGTLGVVTQATLMVKPIPEASSVLGVGLEDPQTAELLLADLIESEVEPTAITVSVRSQKTGRQLPRLGTDADAATVWIGLEGSEADVRWMLDRAVACCGRRRGRTEVLDGAKADTVWRSLTDFAAAADDESAGPALTVEVAVLPSQTLIAARTILDLDPDAVLIAHIGDGLVIARFPCPPDQAGALADRVRQSAGLLHGKAVVLAYPAASRLGREAVWGPAGDEVRVMERIKRQFDPENVLNPGRFIY